MQNELNAMVDNFWGGLKRADAIVGLENRTTMTSDMMLRKKISDIKSNGSRFFIERIKKELVNRPFDLLTVFKIKCSIVPVLDEFLEMLEQFGFVVKRTPEKEYVLWSLSQITETSKAHYDFSGL